MSTAPAGVCECCEDACMTLGAGGCHCNCWLALQDVRHSNVGPACDEEAALVAADALERRLASRSRSLPYKCTNDQMAADEAQLRFIAPFLVALASKRGDTVS